MENITFWNPPFERYYRCVYDAEGDFCFRFTFESGDYDKDEEKQQTIIDILNDKTNRKLTNKLEIVDGYKIYMDGSPFIMIRGWGRLTGLGAGGLWLDHDVARKIQDDFAKWIVDKLKK